MAVAPVQALFQPAGAAGFRAAPATAGPWDARSMHGGAPAGLLAHAIEALEPGSELMVARLTIEFLAAVPIGDVAVQASLAKPGRRFQVVDAELHAGDRQVCLARAVRLRRADMPDAQAPRDQLAPLPAPGRGAVLPPFSDGGGFYPDATEIRHVGGEFGSGHVVAWIRLRGNLFPGVPPSPLVRAVAAADFANGLSQVLPFDDWTFVNTELTVHVHREPAGEWIGLDARTVTAACGVGLATGALHDRDGPFGTCAESLFVEPR